MVLKTGDRFKDQHGCTMTIHTFIREWVVFSAADCRPAVVSRDEMQRILNDGWSRVPGRRPKIRLEYDGLSLTLAEWSARLNVKYATLWRRYQRGLPIDKVLNAPAK